MSQRTGIRLFPVIAVIGLVGLAGTVYYKTTGPDDMSRRVKMGATWALGYRFPGTAKVTYNLGAGDGPQTITCGSAGNHLNAGCSKDHWSRTFIVEPGAHVSVIVAAEKVVNATCAISAPGVPVAPPAIQPPDGDTNPTPTRECTATIP